jgi:hypothetical protein
MAICVDPDPATFSQLACPAPRFEATRGTWDGTRFR